MMAQRLRPSAAACDVAQKWSCAARSGPARVRCGWALGTGAHPAVEARLDALARRTRRDDKARAAALAHLLAEADIAAAIGQHLGLRVASVSPRWDGRAVSVKLRGAAGAITATITPGVWTLAEKSAPKLGAVFADLAPSWVAVTLEAGPRAAELRGRRASGAPPAWETTVTRAWQERLSAPMP